ncbi:hypothetical protein E2C01_031740 [Portunus trituberculatus]|uniref:Uncharacterized protein n=1 Tax=Portunus trituberculatus TaxID=210409 RepID=A0A5B7EXQ1_PORTR|nr:hypothetical protein [Portunus trituberculatus]
MPSILLQTNGVMVAEVMSPLVTSVFRLVVITMLFAANCGAMCRTYKMPKYKGVLSYKWITVLSILILNLIYLSFIWAPFTITTFKHNLQDLQAVRQPAGAREHMHVPSTYILAYLEDCNGTLVQKTKLGTVLGETNYGQLILPEGNGPQDLITVSFDQLKKYESDHAHLAQARHSRLGDSLNQWIINVQDVITSSFVYSFILLAVMRKTMADKYLLLSNLQVSLSGFLLAMLPFPLVLATREMANTSNLFALHTSEVSKSGYTMYSIICDVNITQNYVVSIYLECAVVLLVAAVLLVVTQRRFNFPISNTEEDGCEPVQVEDVACKFVMIVGAGWAWPLKPILVTILFCVYGTHWSNVVCWLANMVVAIPVVFIPLAVFLSCTEEQERCIFYEVFQDDAKNTETAEEKNYMDQSTETEVECDDEDICFFQSREMDNGLGSFPMIRCPLKIGAVAGIRDRVIRA